MSKLLHLYDLSNELAKTSIILRQHFSFTKQTIDPLLMKMKNNHISLSCLDNFLKKTLNKTHLKKTLYISKHN